MTDLAAALERARAGGPDRHHAKAEQQGKLAVRERVARLTDEGSFTEDALLANSEQDGFGADGVVTGMATIAGRRVCLMANDPTVKAGSWGPRTVEKIIRIQEQALEHLLPMVYLVDSAGARITEQVQMFPGRRHAGRIFHTEVKMSGVVPQVCVLFGPSAAGGAYIPAFCDVVIMREGNASMYLGSPRMAEMVIGEKVTLEEMGGARMHTGVSGCGHFLVETDEEGIDLAKRYLSYFPGHWREGPPPAPPAPPAAPGSNSLIRDLIPADENKPTRSTCSTWPRSWWSTRWSRPRTCATSSYAGTGSTKAAGANGRPSTTLSLPCDRGWYRSLRIRGPFPILVLALHPVRPRHGTRKGRVAKGGGALLWHPRR